MPDPAVTVAVFTYNQERYVDDALASLGAQTSREFEVLVVDDWSTDGTVARVRDRIADLPVPSRLIVNERNLGLCGSKNQVLPEMVGEYLCWLDGDDAYEPRMIEDQLAFLRRCDDQVAAVFADAWIMSDGGEMTGRRWFDDRPRAEGAIFDALLRQNFIPSATVMARRSVVVELGGYDEHLFVDDWDLWLRIADRYEVGFQDECVARYRLSPGGVTRDPAYAARMLDGAARTLLKWHGRDPETNAYVEREAWALARRTVARDPALGRRVLRDACAVAPSPARRLQVAGASIPGAPAALAGLFALRDAQKARTPTREVRTPGSGRNVDP